MPAGRSAWNSRDASVEAGFACVVRPRLVDRDAGAQLLLAEVFDVGGSPLGRRAPFNRIKAALTRLSIGTVMAVADDSGHEATTRIGCTEGARALFATGTTLRQVLDGRVHFVPPPVATVNLG